MKIANVSELEGGSVPEWRGQKRDRTRRQNGCRSDDVTSGVALWMPLRNNRVTRTISAQGGVFLRT